MNDTATETKASPARKPRKKAPAARTSPGKRRAAKKPAPAAAGQVRALQSMLREVSSRASRAGSKLSDLGSQGATAARRAAISAKSATRRAVQSTVREWKKLDTPRRVEFVATLLAALAATSGAIARGRRRR